MNNFTIDNPWSSLAQQKKAECLLLRGCADKGPHSVFLGIDSYGQYLFLLQLPEDNTNLKSYSLPKISGCLSTFVTIEKDTYFQLLLLEQKNWRLFKLLVQEIITVLEEEKRRENERLMRLLVDTLKRCSFFFSRKREPFTREMVLGLYGEIYFLLNEASVRVGWDKAISTWRGPLGHPQDYVIGTSAIEVKTTETGQHRTVRISSLEQLNPLSSKGYLYVVSLTEAVNIQGKSLNDLVDETYSLLKSASVSSQDLDLKLSLYGYSATSRFSNQEYAVTECVFYHLAKNFPRIASDAVCLGIESVRYSLNLNFCSSFIVKPDLS